jgi:hypothetical protein
MVTTTEPIVRSPRNARERTDQLLLWAAYLFTAAVIVHNSDHVRRGTDAISRDVFWAGTATTWLRSPRSRSGGRWHRPTCSSTSCPSADG